MLLHFQILKFSKNQIFFFLLLGIDVKPDDDGERISCTMCPGSYKNQDSLDAHCRKAHNIFKRATVSPVVTIAIKAQNNKTPVKPNQNIIKIENDSANDSMNVDGSKCPICKGCYKNLDSLESHCRIKHNVKKQELKMTKFELRNLLMLKYLKQWKKMILILIYTKKV